MKRQEPYLNRQQQTFRVFERIRKAYEYFESIKGNEEALKKARDRFQEQVIPECKIAGIDEQFAWGLLYFGKNYLDNALTK